MSRPKQILVVDDEEQNLRLLKAFLEALGHEAETAGSGFDALRKLNSGFDLVLLDIVMPGIDGLEVVRRIRDDPEVSEIPIIMVTVLGDRETRLAAVEAGANDFIVKPIDKLELRIRLESLLKMKEAQDEIKRHHTELEDAVEKRTAELAESERRFRIMADFSQDLEYWQGTDGQLIYVSPSCERITGYSPNELKADPDLLNRIIHADDRALVMKHSEEVHVGLNEDQNSINFRIVSKDKRVVWINHVCRSVLGEQGEWLGTRVDNRNVTPQKLLEDALLESQRRFVTLFEAAQDCMFIKDKNLKYADVNPAITDLLGIPRTEFIGKTDEDLFGEDYFLHTKAIESRVLKDQVIESHENLNWKSFSTNWSVVRFPLKGASDEMTGICGIARELVEQSLAAPDSVPDAYSGPYSSYVTISTMAKADTASQTTSTILLTGETGSGKDHLARYIHDHSSNILGPFIGFNCAAIPLELAESELFGHEAGAFTGGVRRKRGVLELAEGGTLLLNEIGELSIALQAKLLTFLDNLSFIRVGGEKTVTVNLRLIAATNRDLDAEVSQGRFRRDLFYRLNVFPIHVPALRERKEDIPLLAKQILSQLAGKMGLSSQPSIDSPVLAMLRGYSWPGNVRELKNILERALILSQGGLIRADHITLHDTLYDTAKKSSIAGLQNMPSNRPLNSAVGETQRALVEEALRASNGKKQEAARQLGISRYAFARLLKKVGVTSESRPK